MKKVVLPEGHTIYKIKRLIFLSNKIIAGNAPNVCQIMKKISYISIFFLF